MKRYNTPHRSRVVKTRLTDEEYADFTARLAPYGMSQSEFIRLYRKNSYTEFFARAQFIKDFLSRIRYNFSKPGSVSDSKMLRIPLIFGITFLFIL